MNANKNIKGVVDRSIFRSESIQIGLQILEQAERERSEFAARKENKSIKIVNKRTYKGKGEYIGRPSVLGNPFVIGKDGSRIEVVEKYRNWLKEKFKIDETIKNELLRLVNMFKNNGELILICWCAPELCHGNVIKDTIIDLCHK